MPRLDNSVPTTAALSRWTSRDWLLVGNIGILSSLLLTGLFWFVLMPLIHTWLDVIVFSLVVGMTLLWFPSALAAAAIKKPGATMAVQVPQVLVLLLLTPIDRDVFIACTFLALIAEPVIALCTRYRCFSTARLGWCGSFIGIGSVMLVGWSYPFVFPNPTLVPIVGGIAIGLTSLLGIGAGWIARRWLAA